MTKAIPTFLERAGVGYFRRRAPLAAQPIDAIHHLNPDERRALRRIEQLTVLRAALAGALSAAAVSGFDTFVLAPHHGAHRYLLLGVVAVASAVLEIGFLYWDALRSVHDLAHAAGLDIFDEIEEERDVIATALARAALELPNPPEPLYGVDPRREATRLRLAFLALLYKTKIGITNFLVRALVRRALGRAAARGLLSFVAVPVTACWTSLVAFRVLREARIRVLGPSAIDELTETILAAAGPLDARARDTCVRAVASAIVRTRDMHPNLRLLLRRVSEELGAGGDELGDPEVFLTQLEALSPRDQRTAICLLNVAAVIDGRLRRAELALIKEALERTGHPACARHVRALRRAFIRGDAIEPGMALRAHAEDDGEAEARRGEVRAAPGGEAAGSRSG